MVNILEVNCWVEGEEKGFRMKFFWILKFIVFLVDFIVALRIWINVWYELVFLYKDLNEKL